MTELVSKLRQFGSRACKFNLYIAYSHILEYLEVFVPIILLVITDTYLHRLPWCRRYSKCSVCFNFFNPTVLWGIYYYYATVSIHIKTEFKKPVQGFLVKLEESGFELRQSSSIRVCALIIRLNFFCCLNT